MANQIEITITGSNRSRPAVEEAERTVNRMNDSLRRMGETAGGILAADAISSIGERATQFLSDSVKAASDLGESLNAMDKIFGESSDVVKKWGDEQANAFGLSQREFQQMAVPMGAILKNTGLDMKSVASNTIDLTERAADMASVFNTDVGVALEAIQAGLRGESDPLEQFGVGMNAAAVEARALADTGKTVVTSLTEQEKMTARIKIIMDQTASSAGDFADTSDSLANATRISTAQMEEAQAKIGAGLLPVMAKGAAAVGLLAEGFSKIPEPMQSVTLAVTGIGAALVILGPRILAAKVALAEMGISAAAAATGIKTFIGAFAGITAVWLGLDLLGDAVESLSGKSAGIDKLTKSLTDLSKTGDFAGDLKTQWEGVFGGAEAAVENFGQALRETLDPTFVQQYIIHPFDEFSAVLPGFVSNMEEWTGKFSEMDKALAGMVQGGNATAARDAFSELEKKAKDAGIPVTELMTLFPEYADAARDLGEKTLIAAAGTQELGEKSAETEEEVKSLKETFEEFADTLLQVDSAEIQFQEALDNATESIKEHGRNLDITSEAGRANKRALMDIASSAQDVLTSMEELNVSNDHIIFTAQEQRRAFIDVAKSMGMSSAEANRLADTYGLIPEKVRTVLEAKTAEAEAALERTKNKVNDIPSSKTITIYEQYIVNRNAEEARNSAHGGISGAQGGGPRSNLTWVGEQGPELVKLPFGSMVYPAPTSRSMANGTAGGGWRGGDEPVRVELIVSSAGSQFDDLLVEVIRHAVGIRGGNVQRALGT